MENLNSKIEAVLSKIESLEGKVGGLHGNAKAVVLSRVASLTSEYHVLMKELCDGLGIGYFPRG